MADPGELEFLLGILGEDVGSHGVQALHAGGSDVLVAGVEQDHRVAVVVESLGNAADPSVAPGEEDAGGILGGEAEALGQRRGDEAVEEDGADDDEEDDGNDLIGLGGDRLGGFLSERAVGSLVPKLDGKDGGDRRGDNPRGARAARKVRSRRSTSFEPRLDRNTEAGRTTMTRMARKGDWDKDSAEGGGTTRPERRMKRREMIRTRRFSLNSRMWRTETDFWLARAIPRR